MATAQEVEQVLGPVEDVALCLEGSSAWRQAAEPAGLAADSC